MTDVITDLERDGERLASARRAAGLTTKELAAQLNLRLSDVDRVETGQRPASPLLEEFTSGASTESSKGNEADEPEMPAQSLAPIDASVPKWGTTLILASLIGLVTIRFFTEVIPVLPAAATVIDVPIFIVLGGAALLVGRRKALEPKWLPAAAYFVFAAIAVAALTNLSRVELLPALLFAYGLLSPFVIYVAVFRLWQPGNAKRLTWAIIALGCLQIFVVLAIQLPTFLTASEPNPDDISGTFGENAYQLVFFLIVFVAVLSGIYVKEKQRPVARFALPLVGASIAIILLAQYRALLLTTVVAFFLIFILLRLLHGRTLIAAVGIAVISVLALSIVSDAFPELKIEEAVQLNPVELADKRLEALSGVDDLYIDNPRYIATGAGPGTFSSRAWRTFSQFDSTSSSNTIGRYVARVSGGSTKYSTDVAREFTEPALRRAEVVSGSTAVNSPFSSYAATAAEIGLPGMLAIIAIYLGTFFHLLPKAYRFIGPADAGDPLPACILGAVVALFLLIQMGVLDNWLEVARLTFITWIIVAVAVRELVARREFVSSGA